jgi:hypothetical protein
LLQPFRNVAVWDYAIIVFIHREDWLAPTNSLNIAYRNMTSFRTWRDCIAECMRSGEPLISCPCRAARARHLSRRGTSTPRTSMALHVGRIASSVIESGRHEFLRRAARIPISVFASCRWQMAGLAKYLLLYGRSSTPRPPRRSASRPTLLARVDSSNKRREFNTLLCGAAAWPLSAHA